MYIYIHIIHSQGRTMIKEGDILRCRYCNKLFTPTRFWQRFCTREHQKEYWKKVHAEKRDFSKRIEKIEEQLGIK